MNGLVATRPLLRLALRRDRIALPIWIAAIVATLIAQLSGIQAAYDDARARTAYAITTAASAPARMFGAVDGPGMGSIMMNEIYVTAAVLVALMSSMLVVRHTRQNEQAGRLELVGSARVGHHASLMAALLLALGANVVLAIAAFAVLAALGLPITGSAIMACAIGGIGIAFAGVAAVTSQLAGSSRGANGLAGMVLGIAFLLRAAGDVFGSTSSDGMHVIISGWSWLSPIGWGQLAYPFGEQRWFALAPYVVAFVVLGTTAIALSAHRDIGRGMLPTRARPATASPLLSGPFGLALRLQRNVWIAWCVGLAVTGATLGAFAGEMDAMLRENDAATAMFEAFGAGTEQLVEAYYAICMSFVAVTLAAYVVQSTMRLREEEGAALEPLLATPLGRVRWLASHVIFAMVGSVLLLAISGLATALVDEAVGGTPISIGDIMASAMVNAPALLVIAGFCTLSFGIGARHAAQLGWSAFFLSLIVLIGELFRLPDLVLDASPFSHVPLVPIEEFDATPLVTLVLIASAMTMLGALLFRRRDIAGR